MPKGRPKGFAATTIEVYRCRCEACGIIYESAMPKSFPCPQCSSPNIIKTVTRTVEVIKREKGLGFDSVIDRGNVGNSAI